MYPVSARFLQAVRNPPAITTRVEVWRGGARVDTFGDAGLPIYSGEVTVDGAKQIRRTLTGMRVDASDAMWDLLSPVGTRLHVYRGFTYLNGERELIPIGRFVLDDLEETYGGDWDGQVGTAPDLMALVQRAEFPTPRGFQVGTKLTDIITSLLQEVLGTVTMLASSQQVIETPLVEERKRGDAINRLASAIAADVYIAPDGTPTVVDVPQLGEPVWSVDTGDAGILYTANRSRSLARTYSAVSASQSGVSGDTVLDPQVAYDTDPDSPTYYLGPFGLVTYFLKSELFYDPTQMLTAARARLPLVTAARAQLDLTAECNAALTSGDTIKAFLPRRGRGQTVSTERHLIGTLTIPLTPDGTQRITTRSAVADIEDSA